jgi:sensor histidine kinase YesM
MPTEIITALISGIVTLLVAIGTWHFTAKKDRDENKKLVLTKVDELKDDISDINAVVQQQIATQTLEIKHLTTQVEKHNGVIERVYKLEQAVDDMRLRIS